MNRAIVETPHLMMLIAIMVTVPAVDCNGLTGYVSVAKRNLTRTCRFMAEHGAGVDTIRWVRDHVRIIDQTKLPRERVYVEIWTAGQMIEAIQTMQIRGAPALGVAGAFGVVLAAAAVDAPVREGFIAALRPLAQRVADAGYNLRGPIAIVEEGDTIIIDVDRKALDLDVPAAEIARRFEGWRSPASRYRTGVMAKYAALVGSASNGAVTTGPFARAAWRNCTRSVSSIGAGGRNPCARGSPRPACRCRR